MADIPTASQLILDKIDDLANDLKEIKYAINGNGQPGFKVRMDRLEQSAESRKWQFKALFTGLMAVLGKVAYDVYEIIKK